MEKIKIPENKSKIYIVCEGDESCMHFKKGSNNKCLYVDKDNNCCSVLACANKLVVELKKYGFEVKKWARNLKNLKNAKIYAIITNYNPKGDTVWLHLLKNKLRTS